jgi:hypothetical protein
LQLPIEVILAPPQLSDRRRNHTGDHVITQLRDGGTRVFDTLVVLRECEQLGAELGLLFRVLLKKRADVLRAAVRRKYLPERLDVHLAGADVVERRLERDALMLSRFVGELQPEVFGRAGVGMPRCRR